VDAAFVAIEILSEDDRMIRIMEKLEEYEQKGVPNIWMIDLRLKMMSAYSPGALQEIRVAVIASGEPRLELTRQEIFTQVDAE
jgi:Uma2 family endonuclease